MNSVQLANKVWDKIKMHSVTPSPELLRSFVREAAKEAAKAVKEDNLPEFVINNATTRIQGKLDAMKAVHEKLKDDPTNQTLLTEIGRIASERFKEAETDTNRFMLGGRTTAPPRRHHQ